MIKGEFVSLFEEIYQFKAKLERLDYSQVILIPKETTLQTIDQYKPIALLNDFFNIVSKVFANRLLPYINEIMSEPQMGFIKGKSIVDGIALVQEVIHQCKKKSAKGYLLKIDF